MPKKKTEKEKIEWAGTNNKPECSTSGRYCQRPRRLLEREKKKGEWKKRERKKEDERYREQRRRLVALLALFTCFIALLALLASLLGLLPLFPRIRGDLYTRQSAVASGLIH